MYVELTYKMEKKNACVIPSRHIQHTQPTPLSVKDTDAANSWFSEKGRLTHKLLSDGSLEN